LINFVSDLLKSAWKFLVAVGCVLVLWASLATADFRGVHVQLESPSRYVVGATGIALMVAGAIVGLIGRRTEQGEADVLPIQKISIKGHDTAITPYPLALVRGEVTPKKAFVKVWLLREDLSHRPGSFFPSTLPAITNGDGEWEQSVSLWKPGPWRIRAVVTTDEWDNIYRLYRHAYDVALNLYKQQHSDADHVPDWPRFDAWPKNSVTEVCGPIPYPG
jgi:hypothetical protein